MSLQELTSRDAVKAALREFDVLGQEAFLAKYGDGEVQGFRIVAIPVDSPDETRVFESEGRNR